MTSEKDLIEGIINGDEKSCAKVLNLYKGRIFSYVLRLVKNYDDAEEITFEVFIKFFNSIDKFDPARKISAWLFSIAHNLVIDFFRKNKIEYEYLDERHQDPDYTIEKYEKAKKMAMVEDALQKLTSLDREIVILFHKEGMSYHEISRILNLPVTTIKTRLHRARNRLRELLK
ncbi:MAG: RNA polymerase sigma factor [candidate division WOR-3 bacterium]|nr:RNA polymerase sigma factor [candidate division WOR-3 bacterium]